MSLFPSSDIEAIAASDDLHVSPFREDGTTYGTPTWIWSVVVDGRLFIRAWNGPRGRWYRAAISQGAGRVTAAGKTYEVAFAPAPEELADRIDAAYNAKYAGSPYLPPMVGRGPRSACCEVTLRD